MQKPPLFAIGFFTFSVLAGCLYGRFGFPKHEWFSIFLTILMHPILKRKFEGFTSQQCHETWARPPHFCTENFCNIETVIKIWQTLQKRFLEGTFLASKTNVLLLRDPPTSIKKKSRKGNATEDIEKSIYKMNSDIPSMEIQQFLFKVMPLMKNQQFFSFPVLKLFFW